MVQNKDMSVPNCLSDLAEEYTCKICGCTFSTTQSLAAHIDLEHLEAEQPDILAEEMITTEIELTVNRLLK